MTTVDWSAATIHTADGFEVCWELLGLGETPWQLDPPRTGAGAADRRAFVAHTLDDLRRRGLADAHGPGPRLAAQLRLLAHPEWSVDIRVRSERLVAGMGACRGAQGVLAVRQGREIGLLDVPADDVEAAVLDLLGTVTPAPGAAFTVPLDTGHGHDPDVRAQAQIGASTSRGDGTRMRRASYVVGLQRTSRGDYRCVRRGDEVLLEPATRARLLDDLRELRASCRR